MMSGTHRRRLIRMIVGTALYLCALGFFAVVFILTGAIVVQLAKLALWLIRKFGEEKP